MVVTKQSHNKTGKKHRRRTQSQSKRGKQSPLSVRLLSTLIYCRIWNHCMDIFTLVLQCSSRHPLKGISVLNVIEHYLYIRVIRLVLNSVQSAHQESWSIDGWNYGTNHLCFFLPGSCPVTLALHFSFSIIWALVEKKIARFLSNLDQTRSARFSGARPLEQLGSLVNNVPWHEKLSSLGAGSVFQFSAKGSRRLLLRKEVSACRLHLFCNRCVSWVAFLLSFSSRTWWDFFFTF